MNKIILAAAIMNAINSTPEVVSPVGSWDNVIAMPMIDEGVQVDPRNPLVSVRSHQVGVGRFGGQCFKCVSSGRFTTTSTPFALHSDFTIETFINFDSLADTNQYIFDFGNNGFILRYYGGTIKITYSGGTVLIDSGFVPTVDKWYHMAVVRRNGLITLYIDGINRGQVSYAVSMAYTTFTIGNYSGGGGYNVNGRLDQFRVSAEAIYTANFTPPSEPFPIGSAEASFDPYWSNVNLLLQNHSGSAMVNQASAATLTAVGSPNISTLTKKIGSASMEFASAGSYYRADQNGLFDFGSQEWCVECWVRPSAVISGNVHLVGRRTAAQSGGWKLGLSNMQPVIGASTNNSSWTTVIGPVTGSAIQPNRWTHLAATRVGNTLSLFVDGELIGTVSITAAIQPSTIPVTIGASNDATEQFSGFISGVRITRGDGRYYSNFTPKMKTAFATNGTVVQSAYDPYYAKVNAMFPFSKDVSAGVDMFQIVSQRAGVSIDPSRKLFGQDTLTVQSGAAGGINYNNGTRAMLGAVDSTIEGWVNTDYMGVTAMPIVGQYHASTAGSWMLGIANGKAVFFVRSGVYIESSTVIADSQWHHVAVSIRSGTAYLYVDGSLVAQAAMTRVADYNGNIQIGYNIAAEAAAGYRMNIARVRATQGRGRYVSNFVVGENTVVQAALAA